jgi:hypothetical protein
MSASRAWQYLAFALVMLSWREARVEEHRDAGRHYSFQVPNGWTKFAPEAIALMNAMGKGVFDTGYQPADQLPGDFPYFVVQPTTVNLVRHSYPEIERGLAKLNPIGSPKGNQAFGPVVSNATITSFAFDKSKNRAVVRAELNVLDRKVRGTSYAMVGKNAIIWLHCYALDDEFEGSLQTFNSVAESFRYDQGFEFVPGPGGESFSSSRNRLEQFVMFALLALAIAIISLRHKLFRKWRSGANDNFANQSGS